MNVYDLAWGGLIAAGLAFEVVALRRNKQGDTLSEFTRKWFRTGDPETPGSGSKWGRRAFLVGWAGFSAWYAWHILWQVW